MTKKPIWRSPPYTPHKKLREFRRAKSSASSIRYSAYTNGHDAMMSDYYYNMDNPNRHLCKLSNEAFVLDDMPDYRHVLKRQFRKRENKILSLRAAGALDKYEEAAHTRIVESMMPLLEDLPNIKVLYTMAHASTAWIQTCLLAHNGRILSMGTATHLFSSEREADMQRGKVLALERAIDHAMDGMITIEYTMHSDSPKKDE